LGRSTATSYRTLERQVDLGYQEFSPWYEPRLTNEHGVTLNDPDSLRGALDHYGSTDCHFYTSHQIYWEDNVIKQTRSSPNWEGGMVTYCTCKHLMRCTDKNWGGVWIATVGPRECSNNCLIMAGRISRVFPSNYALRRYMSDSHPDVFTHKIADIDPRADLYTPRYLLEGPEVYHHENFREPPEHTRSVDFYKRSPGSVSNREDGKIPKWWRDMEYIMHGRRPPVFILSPCWIFSEPMLWSVEDPKRAALKMTARTFGESLYGHEQDERSGAWVGGKRVDRGLSAYQK
jgi:hypothetical protein